jgi:hypothetical protein
MAPIPRVAQMHPDFEWDVAKYWVGRFAESKNPLYDGRFLLIVTNRQKASEDGDLHGISGTIEDCLGSAVFDGLIDKDRISFSKRYTSIAPDPFVTDATGKARTASTDMDIAYKGARVYDGFNVLYEGTYEIQDKSYKGNGTFVLVSQGATTPLDTTRAKFKASWEAARNIPI